MVRIQNQASTGETSRITFNHVQAPDIQELDTETVDGKRHYKTPDGQLYPSVTTVLSLHSAEGIKRWRDEIGHEKAQKISTQASGRGTKIHKLCEDYINNVEDYYKGHMPVNVQSFNHIKPILDSCLNNIVMQEVPLYSHYLQVGGRVDCIGEWNGKLSVIDFKTSRKLKEEKWIKSYYMQAAAYCVMYEELTGIPITNTVILIAVDNEDPQVFHGKRDNYIDDFMELRDSYRKIYGK